MTETVLGGRVRGALDGNHVILSELLVPIMLYCHLAYGVYDDCNILMPDGQTCFCTIKIGMWCRSG